MDRQRKPCRNDGFRLEQMDDETLLYHPAGDKILQFNQTASIIWQLCDGQRSVDELIELLQEAYPEAAAEIAGDVEEILQQFAENGCIQWL